MHNIGMLLQQIASLMARQSDQLLLKQFDIGFSQFKILTTVNGYSGMTQKRIAQRIGQTEASISRQIKLMYDDGLLQSTPRPDNRRERIITLTPRGKRVTERAIDEINQHFQPVFAQLSAKVQQDFAKTLQSAYDNLVEQE